MTSLHTVKPPTKHNQIVTSRRAHRLNQNLVLRDSARFSGLGLQAIVSHLMVTLYQFPSPKSQA
ncbi:hypothetical protein LEMLEM_LOCUS22172 [Lemmus lemmus]